MTAVLDINGLIVSLGKDAQAPRIIDNVSLQVAQGETPESAMSWAEGELKTVYKL